MPPKTKATPARRPKLISKTDFAKQLKSSKAYVSKLLREEIIEEEDNGLIDPKKAMAGIRAAADPARRQFRRTNGTRAPDAAASGTGKLSYQTARTAHEGYKAKLAELEYRRAMGQLVDAEEVKAAAFNAARSVRDAIKNIPDRIAPLLAAETNPRKVHAMLTDELNKALEALASDAARGV